MSHGELFDGFLGDLNPSLKQAKKVSCYYQKITKSLNLVFRGANSRIANRSKMGSISRHTAIKGIFDLDMLYIIPPNQYEYYNHEDNGQSALLTDIRNILAEECPD